MKAAKSLLLIVVGLIVLQTATGFAAEDSTNRPFLAIWRDNGGYRPGGEVACLRIAIWNDGRAVFARDPNTWSNDLFEGKIDESQVAELRSALEKTDVFKLKGYCYLVPEGPVHCIMLDLGDKQQMLYWDEVETPGFGINISPKPHHVRFMNCWKEVNRLALAVIPNESKPYTEPFNGAPTSWRLKRPVQSQ